MYLYTQGGKDLLGCISDAQMQTTLATALATSNDAMDNSDIDLTFSLVYVGQVRLVLSVTFCIYSGSSSSTLSPRFFSELSWGKQHHPLQSNVNIFIYNVFVARTRFPASQLPYEETSTSSSTILYNLSTDEDVADLRDAHNADLVQMAGKVGYSCGIG